MSEVQVLAAESGVTLVVTGATGWTRCDADRLVQALVNLIGNAVKFSPLGTTVEISAEPLGSSFTSPSPTVASASPPYIWSTWPPGR